MGCGEWLTSVALTFLEVEVCKVQTWGQKLNFFISQLICFTNKLLKFWPVFLNENRPKLLLHSYWGIQTMGRIQNLSVKLTLRTQTANKKKKNINFNYLLSCEPIKEVQQRIFRITTHLPGLIEAREKLFSYELL